MQDSLLERQINAAPHAPGCYIFKDQREKVLYVGKAKDIAARADTAVSDGAPSRAQD